jgi:hypothetical protein
MSDPRRTGPINYPRGHTARPGGSPLTIYDRLRPDPSSWYDMENTRLANERAEFHRLHDQLAEADRLRQEIAEAEAAAWERHKNKG